ncbi:MAG: SurA N-terminal domain-containing protein [Gammaproteobacteria bacterium]|nr:SurA N-terminal domain-containing protein [Gammaproteobacteria bacterium]
MLMNLRDRLSGWIAYAIVVFISIPFVLWGIGEYFRGGSDAPVATVNGQDITPRAFEQAYNQERQRLAQAFGGTLPPDMLEGLGLKRQVLDGLILREVLRQWAHQQGLRVSDAELAAVLRGVSAFQENGVFSQARYKQVLSLQGQSPLTFEQAVRQDLVLDQLQRGIALSAFDVAANLDAFLRLRGQTREVEVYILSSASRRAGIQPDEAQLQTYFKEHMQDFRRPERVRLEYIVLSMDELAARMKPSEEDIRQAYEDYLAREAQRERREARHILITPPEGGDMEAARKQAEALHERLVAGEDFASLAKQYSQDPGSAGQGGELGLVERGMMVEPFEKALFALKEGEVSAPVQTDFGWHLIKLERIEKAKPKPLDEVREAMLRDAAQRMAEERFHDLADRLATLAYEQPDSLTPAAEALGLKVHMSGWVTRDQGEGLGANPKLRAAAFTPEVLEQRRNSDLIDLSGNQVAVIRVAEHEAAADQPFETVRAEVQQRVVEQEMARLVEADAARLRQALSAAGAADEVLRQVGAERGFVGELKRLGADEVDPAIRRAAFAVGRPTADAPLVGSVRLGNGDMAVVRVLSVKDGDPAALDEGERHAIREELRQNVGIGELSAFIAHLKARAEITQRQNL